MNTQPPPFSGLFELGLITLIFWTAMAVLTFYFHDMNTTYLSVLLGVLIAVLALRAYLNTRERQRARRVRRFKMHHGIRDFAGQDWTLPTWERHTTWNERRRSRETHSQGSVAAELLFALFGAVALYVIAFLLFSLPH